MTCILDRVQYANGLTTQEALCWWQLQPTAELDSQKIAIVYFPSLQELISPCLMKIRIQEGSLTGRTPDAVKAEVSEVSGRVTLAAVSILWCVTSLANGCSHLCT